MDAGRQAVSWWPAPAKLNLFLLVTGRRPDGYHELSTAFQFVDYCDWLGIAARDDGAVRLTTPTPGVDPEDDLIVRAARALQQASGLRRGADIAVRKRLPMGGGLGGGSSDAATTLVALNHVWGAGLPPERLAALGLALGADVPVFVHGEAAFAEGVGERLVPHAFPEPWYVILDPGVAVSTAEVFGAPELTRCSAPATISDFSAGSGRNDCEPVVRARYPDIARALDWLAARGPARLTGTGGCLFGWYGTCDEAQDVASAVPPAWRAIVARGRNRSPLLDALAAGGMRQPDGGGERRP